MTWTATLDLVEKDSTNGNIIATVTFTDGQTLITTKDIRAFDLTIESIGDIVAARIAVFEARDTAFATLRSFEGQQITLGKIPTPDPYVVAKQKVAQLQQEVALGIRKADDADLAAALAEAKAALADVVKAEVAAASAVRSGSTDVRFR